jgi:hypothetical protein
MARSSSPGDASTCLLILGGGAALLIAGAIVNAIFGRHAHSGLVVVLAFGIFMGVASLIQATASVWVPDPA